MAEVTDGLAALASEIAETEHALALGHENGFEELVALVKNRLAELLPVLLLAIAAADGEQRAALTRHYRRLEGLLSRPGPRFANKRVRIRSCRQVQR